MSSLKRLWFVILGVETKGLLWIWFGGSVVLCAAHYFRVD